MVSRARAGLIITLMAMLAFSAYGTLSPAAVRCALPGAVGCPGGILGPDVVPAGAGEQWFTVTLFDYGFWIVDSTTGANESNAWNVFEGWTVHVNATSLPPDAAVGGTAYHGLGVEINATGQQLMSLAAPVGAWTPGTFVAPLSEYHHQHLWCTIGCGPGHGGQQVWVLNVIPPVPLPKATASSNLSSGPAPLTVTLTGTPSAGTPPYSPTWDFGDGTPVVNALSTSHTYALGGDYNAQFRVTDSKGMYAAASVAILVNSTAPLTASASASPDSHVAPFTSVLTIAAHGGSPPYSYDWSLGDGATVTGVSSTSHLYSAAGVYAIVVTVRDAAGSTVQALASVTALPPLGYFPVTVTATPPNGSAPIIVQFAAVPHGGSAPYSYLWVLGDGTTGTGSTLSHQYNTTGSYEVNVFASDGSGHVGSAAVNVPLVMAPTGGGGGGDEISPWGSVHAAAAANGTLKVFPLAAPHDGGSPLTVNAWASIEAGTGLGETILWNFGDGTTSTGPQVSHPFARVGTYDVTVTATDSGGNHGSNLTVVHVEPLGMTVVANRSLGDPPFTVTAAVSILGGTGRFGVVSWDWGDGSSSTGNLANHSYAPNTTGVILVGASATDSSGAWVNSSISLSVYPVLVAALKVTLPGSSLPPAEVQFTLVVQGGSGAYEPHPLWGFGDGSSTRSGSSATHSYTKLGDYHVLVQTNDSLGSPVIASSWVNLSVAPPSHGGKPGGTPPWSLTGVSNPNRAALILIGLVAASGLFLLRRRQRRSVKKPSRPAPSARPAAPQKAKVAPGPARTAAPTRPVSPPGARIGPGRTPPGGPGRTLPSPRAKVASGRPGPGPPF